MPDFIFTHTDELIEIQETAIRKNFNEANDAGCEGTVRDGAMVWLDYIIEHPEWVPELKTDVVKYSAFVLHTIATHHPFGQANKRTSFAAAENCLQLCGYKIVVDNNILNDFLLDVSKKSDETEAEEETSRKAIEEWLLQFMVKIEKNY
jgi:death-on-curing family protein